MCGIAGILSGDDADRPSQAELAGMIAQLRHRGPDGTGFFAEGPVGLGHARLSIIDLSTGDQPIHNEDRTAWVVLNGEIFNYVELRADLERAGHRFYTQSDTEVIVHLYEQHGDQFVQHLNGQFAIAIWDSKRHRLVLARDRTGIRPLFYAQHKSRLLFASEVKALFAVRDVPRRIDPLALAEIFTFWAPIGSRTTFDGVHALPPGHILVSERGNVRVSQYWDWEFPTESSRNGRSAANYAEELRALLVDAVKLQLRADVPVGAYLSGGLDSSVITALIHHFTDTPLRTFSVTFDDEEFDESAHQRDLVKYLGTDHSDVRCSRADIAKAFPRAIWHTESPIVRTAPTPLMLLSGLVREHGFKVVLTGEGADEVFGGYDLFKEARLRRLLARSPESPRGPRLLKSLYPYLKHSPATSGAFAQRFFSEGAAQIDEPYFGHIPRWTTTRRTTEFFSPSMRESVGGWDHYAAITATLPSAIRTWSPLARDQYVEAHTLLSGYLLSSQGDRMGMANSIEGRFPFLDHRVIEFANKLPPRLKLMGLTEKYILRSAVNGLLPDGARTRPKQPYRAPDSQSFFVNGAPVDYVAELTSESRIADAGYFAPRAVRKLVDKCAAGRAIGFGDNMAFVGVLSTMLIHDQFVRAMAPSATA
ncbi:MAG TPA: asparagine synthase (glutamine-hydrolyzing) [Gemmatimonadaceae bacterium]|nr:asparagine synthase (glutamine-hydrolyzing) [Gemmatimonadaceae bacterium]